MVINNHDYPGVNHKSLFMLSAIKISNQTRFTRQLVSNKQQMPGQHWLQDPLWFHRFKGHPWFSGNQLLVILKQKPNLDCYINKVIVLLDYEVYSGFQGRLENCSSPTSSNSDSGKYSYSNINFRAENQVSMEFL